MNTGVNVFKKSKCAVSFTDNRCPICGHTLGLYRKYIYCNKNKVTIKISYICKCGFTCPIKYTESDPNINDTDPLYFNEIQDFVKDFGSDI